MATVVHVQSSIQIEIDAAFEGRHIRINNNTYTFYLTFNTILYAPFSYFDVICCCSLLLCSEWHPCNIQRTLYISPSVSKHWMSCDNHNKWYVCRVNFYRFCLFDLGIVTTMWYFFVFHIIKHMYISVRKEQQMDTSDIRNVGSLWQTYIVASHIPRILCLVIPTTVISN
jgi:hypothetical protein